LQSAQQEIYLLFLISTDNQLLPASKNARCEQVLRMKYLNRIRPCWWLWDV